MTGTFRELWWRVFLATRGASVLLVILAAGAVVGFVVWTAANPGPRCPPHACGDTSRLPASKYSDLFLKGAP